MAYSVLISVYNKELPENLRQSLESIRHQSVPTDDCVLVCDGPLTEELYQVIADLEKDWDALRVLRLSQQCGLGNALNQGMALCRHDLIARMDSDDISRPDRCEKQLALFRDDPSLSIVSGTVEEFSQDPAQVDARRELPQDHKAILAFAKKRSPFNHPCVMYRKRVVEAAGGYQDFYLFEDYYLWIRMLLNGAKAHNLPEPLLWMRAGSNMYRRRSGWKYLCSQNQLFAYMRRRGMISWGEYLGSVALRSASALAPNGLRTYFFKRFLRK